MYNRYVPQPDGTFQKNRIQTSQETAEPMPQIKIQNDATVISTSLGQEQQEAISAGSFLKRLIPSNLDTGDLLVIILLLLMAGDCKEEKNSALLTLALYLFL